MLSLSPIMTTLLIHLNLTSKIEQLSNEFLNGTLSAGLLTEDLAFWKTIKHPFPILIRRLEDSKNSSQILDSFIIDLRHNNIEESHLLPFHRNGRTKFIILTSEEKFDENKRRLLEIGLCDVLLLIVNSSDVTSHLLTDPCKGIGILPNKSFNCKGNISFLNLPPYISWANGKLIGYEGLLIQSLTDKMGFNLSFINRHETGYGWFDPPEGLQGDIFTKTSIIGIGSLFPFHWRNQWADVVMGCGYIDIGWAVPVGAGPSKPTWYIILVSEFSNTIWLCIFFVYLALIPISMLLDRRKEQNISWPMYNLALLLGVPQNLTSLRTLTICVTISGFLLTSHYLTVMSSKLTAPSPVPEITTEKQMLESGMRIIGPPTGGRIVTLQAEGDPENEVKQQLSKVYESTLAELDEILPNIVRKRDTACLRHIGNIVYRSEKNPITRGKIHIVEEQNEVYWPLTILPKHSCLTKKLQDGFYKLCDSGLVSKWIREMTEGHRDRGPSERGPRKLALEHIKGFLILLISGLTLAAVAFASELAVFRLRGKHRRIDLFKSLELKKVQKR